MKYNNTVLLTGKIQKVSAFFSLFIVFFIFSFFLFFPVVFAKEESSSLLKKGKERQILEMKDIYIKTYENLDPDSSDATEKRALAKVSEKLGVKEIHFSDSFLQKYCQSETVEGFTQCRDTVIKFYKRTLEKERLSARLEKYAIGNQAFANGTLKDTGEKGFDIIVDLNIIDVILFGDKFEAPQNASPFFPPMSIENLIDNTQDLLNKDTTNKKNDEEGSEEGETLTNKEADADNQNTSSEENTSLPEEEINTPNNTEGKEGETLIQNTDEFCVDPEALFFSTNIKKTNTQQNNANDSSIQDNGNTHLENTDDIETTSSFQSAQDMQNGDYFSEKDLLSDGIYPNLDDIIEEEKKNGQRKACDADEHPIFGGRLCVPKFCNDVICVRIQIKRGYNKENLRPLDCVECHIDRGNEALTPFINTLGQSTPQNNPMEPNFASAFSNFRGDINVKNLLIFQAKKLPFLKYDQGDSLSDQKRKEEQTPEEKEKENREKEKRALDNQIEKNRKIFESLTFDCSSINSNKIGNISDQSSYCIRQKEELYDKNKTTYDSDEEAETIAKNDTKTAGYKNTVQPFFNQFTSTMQQINIELKKIDLENIKKSKINCSSF